MDAGQAAAAFGALAQETRIAIVRHLVVCGGKGSAAGDVAFAVGATASRASFHLASLEKAGLISAERVSRNVVYRARTDSLGALVAYMLEDCCAGDERVRRCCG